MMSMVGKDMRAVCRRCHMVIDDAEPMAGGYAEFFHKRQHKDGTASKCKNAGKTFFRHASTGWEKEVVPFLRKRTRRAAKRAGVRT